MEDLFDKNGNRVATAQHVAFINTWRGNEKVYRGERKGLFVKGNRVRRYYLNQRHHSKIKFIDGAQELFYLGRFQG